MHIHPGCKVILKRLLNRKKIGNNYTPQTRALKWAKRVPKQERKAFLESYTELIKHGWIITKHKPNGTMISIHPKHVEDVSEEIK